MRYISNIFNNFWVHGPLIKLFYSKRERLNIPPEKLMVSLTNRCNLHCLHCPRGSFEQEEKDMPRELVDYVIEKVLPHCKYLRIGGNSLGEPLVSDDFDYFLSRAGRTKLRQINLITNLSVLDKKRAVLMSENIDNVSISVEGYGDDYTRIRGVRWKNLLDNIVLLKKAKKNTGSNKMKIQLVVCTMLSSIENLSRLFDLRDLGIDKIYFREFVDYTGTKNDECLYKDFRKVLEFIKKTEMKSRSSNIAIGIEFKKKYTRGDLCDKKKREKSLNKCYFPWDCVSITGDGNVSCCCDERLRLGEINAHTDIASVWNNERFIAMRKTVNSADPPDVCAGCFFKTEKVL